MLRRSRSGLRSNKWAVPGSNQRPPGCKPGALPTELTALTDQGATLLAACSVIDGCGERASAERAARPGPLSRARRAVLHDAAGGLGADVIKVERPGSATRRDVGTAVRRAASPPTSSPSTGASEAWSSTFTASRSARVPAPRARGPTSWSRTSALAARKRWAWATSTCEPQSTRGLLLDHGLRRA